MLVKFPMTLASCLKYLCLASNRVVQWLTSGPNLKDSQSQLHIRVHENTCKDMHTVTFYVHTKACTYSNNSLGI